MGLEFGVSQADFAGAGYGFDSVNPGENFASVHWLTFFY
jgi:hypothetical protein